MTLALDDGALNRLLDRLLPGDGHFPPASTTDIASLVRSRLARLGGADAEDRLAAALLALGDAAAIERERPQLFDLFRRAAYLAYYEAPQVIAAIRGLGIDYRGAPQPQGYTLAAFDPAIDAPSHGRGGWKTTAETGRGRP